MGYTQGESWGCIEVIAHQTHGPMTCRGKCAQEPRTERSGSGSAQVCLAPGSRGDGRKLVARGRFKMRQRERQRDRGYASYLGKDRILILCASRNAGRGTGWSFFYSWWSVYYCSPLWPRMTAQGPFLRREPLAPSNRYGNPQGCVFRKGVDARSCH